MTTMKIIENVQKFLEDNVCNTIRLKCPYDNDTERFELINPVVYPVYMPLKRQLPPGIKSAIPCLVVGFDEAEDDGQETGVKIRILAGVYDPGTHVSDGDEVMCVPDTNGWCDLINLLDRTRAEICKSRLLNNTGIQYPVKWGVYQQDEQMFPDLNPYYFGWMSFSVSAPSYPASEIAKKYL